MMVNAVNSANNSYLTRVSVRQLNTEVTVFYVSATLAFALDCVNITSALHCLYYVSP